MKVLINKYGIDKTIFGQKWFSEETHLNGQVVEIEDTYNDCVFEDFELVNNEYVFSIEKYNARKQRENADNRIAEIKPRLEQLSQDLIQAQAGAVFEDLEERKAEFKTLHNELRVLLGKEPREYN